MVPLIASWETDLLVALAAGTLGVVLAVLTGVKQIIAKKAELTLRRMEEESRPAPKDRYYDALVRFGNFLKMLNDISSLEAVERVLLFVGKNGGGLPDPTRPYTVTATYGWTQDPKRRNPKSDYDFDLIVDESYCRMLAEMIKEGKSVQTTVKMKESVLRKYYENEGVVQSILYFLNIDSSNGEMLFASFASYAREFTPEEVRRIDVKVDRMKSIIARKVDGGGSGNHQTLR